VTLATKVGRQEAVQQAIIVNNKEVHRLGNDYFQTVIALPVP
jgi:hypothetical protein